MGAEGAGPPAAGPLSSLGPILKDMDRCAPPLTGHLRDLALAALAGQGVAVRRLRWMGQHTNHLFRCDTAAGERLIIRVCLPGGRSDAELDAELAWLAALARDTGLTVPAPGSAPGWPPRAFRAVGAASGSAGSRAGPADAGHPGGWPPTSAG